MLSPQNHFMCSQPAGKNMDYIQAVGSPKGSSTARMMSLISAIYT